MAFKVLRTLGTLPSASGKGPSTLVNLVDIDGVQKFDIRKFYGSQRTTKGITLSREELVAAVTFVVSDKG